MYYALLIYQREGLFEALSEPERETLLAEHHKLQEDSFNSGSFAGATKLMPTSTAVTLHKEGDQLAVIDGPFAETKEVLAGFYLFNCETLEEAIEYGKRIPHIQAGKIEIRPVSYSNSPGLLLET